MKIEEANAKVFQKANHIPFRWTSRWTSAAAASLRQAATDGTNKSAGERGAHGPFLGEPRG
jgi:hypothetical protein